MSRKEVERDFKEFRLRGRSRESGRTESVTVGVEELYPRDSLGLLDFGTA